MDVFAMKRQSDCANFDERQKSALKNNVCQKSVLKSATLHHVMPYFSALKASIFFTRVMLICATMDIIVFQVSDVNFYKLTKAKKIANTLKALLNTFFTKKKVLNSFNKIDDVKIQFSKIGSVFFSLSWTKVCETLPT